MPDTPLDLDLLIHEADVHLPRPAAGHTIDRWRHLADLARTDLSRAKLIEPHHDAVAILADLGLDAPEPASLWAVWAAEPPFAKVTARRHEGRWTLEGTKAFCSGAAFVTDALISADADDGVRMFAIDVSRARADGSFTVDEPTWVGLGMAAADTRTTHLADVPAREVGGPRAYLERPGFWHGAVGIAACWLGGAESLAAPLQLAGGKGRLDPHGLAHLGAVTVALDSAWGNLHHVASAFDADPADAAGRAQRNALTARTQVADVVDEVIARVGRALGPGPLAFDASHARRVADLQVFVRQHHAERDLQSLGEIVAGGTDGQ